MTQPILYLGDDALDRAAAYLGGVLTHAGLDFDHAPSDRDVDDALLDDRRSLYIISDFPVKRFGSGQMERIVEDVRERGAGLVMIGGWESFHGAAGEYNGTPIADVLPVEIAESDDRVNCPQPCLVKKLRNHPITDGLPFDKPPGIGGYNRVTAREDTQTVLTAQRFEVDRKGGDFKFSPCKDLAPLLVVGGAGEGRTAAFATDVAPHWVGGLVDWGLGRVEAQADGGNPIEVGDEYARLLVQMVRWAGNDGD